MTARFLVGDVRARMTELDDDSFDLILCSPPFLALRSYLPDGHPDKHLEIGSEATPAEYLDVLLQLTAEWGRLLAPHGSIAIELGDTYAGSGGGGGDYLPGGLREGEPGFGGSSERAREGNAAHWRQKNQQPDAWPLDKSLVCVPQLYQVALAYGINPLTGTPSPAGRWRVRNLKAWIRSNPPVGALGDKERPATSYIIVACRARDRWFDLDAVRTLGVNPGDDRRARTDHREDARVEVGLSSGQGKTGENAAGAPPRDWWHHTDQVLQAELDARAGKTPRGSVGSFNGGAHRYPGHGTQDEHDSGSESVGAQGHHLRRALERAGILPTPPDVHDISPKGYAGAHYAVWPPELVRLLVDEMCPRHVCTVCGEPSRRIVETERVQIRHNQGPAMAARSRDPGFLSAGACDRTTLGWSDCGHNTWRPGRVLDPFVGSGTTLAVTTGMARDAVGIDIDYVNAGLAMERVGMFLEVEP